MSAAALHDCLQRFPGAALEVSGSGVVRASNGRLDALTGRELAGVELASVLDESSRSKWARILADDDGQPACSWELVFATPTSLELRRFLVVHGGSDGDRVVWLLEYSVDPKLDTLYSEMSELHRELVDAQRKLGREKHRLAVALEKAERAIRTREDVVAIVSHDLRNPLSTITMAASVLELDIPEQVRADHVAIIKRAAANMNRLIIDLLDVSAIEAGRFAVEPEPTPVAPVLEETCRMMTGHADRKGQRLGCSVAPGLPEVLADRDRITQVLSNLIGNAVKFTPEGGTISVVAAPSGSEVVVTVENTGPSIPEEDLPRIFDRFWQARRRRGAGAGLGLAIAKGIVEAHGGRIWAASDVGEGAKFQFTIPVASGG